jgi:hypothetical protein
MAQPAGRTHVLVVDDEAPARQRLVDLLKKDPQAAWRVFARASAASQRSSLNALSK